MNPIAIITAIGAIASLVETFVTDEPAIQAELEAILKQFNVSLGNLSSLFPTPATTPSTPTA
jgi:hypothetical protein